MSKNKSVNSTKTSAAVKYYYEIAKQKDLVGDILRAGGITEQAITITIKRGRISQNVIDAFKQVINADPIVLIGARDPGKWENDIEADIPTHLNSRKAVIPPDALTIDLLNALLTINKLANNTTTELEAMLNTIKLNIVEVAYSNIPTLRESLEPYVAMTPSLFNATDKDGDENEKEDTI